MLWKNGTSRDIRINLLKYYNGHNSKSTSKAGTKSTNIVCLEENLVLFNLQINCFRQKSRWVIKVEQLVTK